MNFLSDLEFRIISCGIKAKLLRIFHLVLVSVGMENVTGSGGPLLFLPIAVQGLV